MNILMLIYGNQTWRERKKEYIHASLSHNLTTKKPVNPTMALLSASSKLLTPGVPLSSFLDRLLVLADRTLSALFLLDDVAEPVLLRVPTHGTVGDVRIVVVVFRVLAGLRLASVEVPIAILDIPPNVPAIVHLGSVAGQLERVGEQAH